MSITGPMHGLILRYIYLFIYFFVVLSMKCFYVLEVNSVLIHAERERVNGGLEDYTVR